MFTVFVCFAFAFCCLLNLKCTFEGFFFFILVIMNATNILKFIGGLDELGFCYNLKSVGKISMLQIDPFNYGLFLYSAQSSHIVLLKLSLNKSICNLTDDLEFNSSNWTSESKIFKIYLLNVICLHFTLLAVVCTKKNVWAIGQEAVVNLTPFVEQAFVESKSYENEDIDVDAIEEFQPNMLDITLSFPMQEKYNLHLNDIFVGCHFLDYALILCHKNSRLSMWELEFLFPSDKMMSPDVMTLSFLDFPVSYNTSCLEATSNQDKSDVHQPLIVFIHHSDPEAQLFKNIFNINCVSPYVICLIGHPDGKLLWCLCDTSHEFQPSNKLQILFDIKQSIVGIFFIKDIKELEGCDCILLVGALGQLTLISPQRYSSFTQETSVHTYWTKTVHVSSSITYCEVLQDCLLYIPSNGALLLCNLSVIFHPSDNSEELSSASSVSGFESIQQMIIADRNKDLIFLKTKYGNLYLTQLKKSMDSATPNSSLPSLMNECLKQSNKMQELLHKKAMQNRLFAAVSTFASLKFLNNTLKESVTFSISEINDEPKKYILVINLTCLDSLNLDPELCHITATAFTFFKNNNTFLSKSAPYKADEPTLCLEIIDTVLQPPFVSAFPLFVEVGLILQLPEEWKVIDCFKSVSSFLPFYIRIQTFMVHELNLLQNNALCFPQSLKFDTPKTLKMIKEIGMNRPVSNIFQTDSKTDFNLLKKFNLCLSVSTVEEMLKNTSESDPCKYIEKLLLGNILNSSISKESYLMSKCSPMSINVSKNSNHLVISLAANNPQSLIGLKIAVMETLLATHRQIKQSTSSSTYINIPASIYRKCEEISKSLMNLYGKDINSDEVIQRIINLYKELRTDISGKLPIL